MHLISKEIAQRLHNECGIKWGGGGLSKSKSHHPKYYLCESEYNLRKLLSISKDDQAEQLLKDLRKRRKEEETITY